jgi:MFS family permease
LLIADFVSDVGTFLQSVGAAWLMTSLTSSPVYIALIQTASALPFFLLALPAGSIGDIVDRRKLILRTEWWMVAVAVAIAAATVTHTMSPWLLLVLTFFLSAGDAIESPTWRAIFPELVPKDELAPAIALNGIEFNLARAVGPGLAGLIIAVAGVGAAFVLNVFSFFGVIWVVSDWKRPIRESKLPAETLTGATLAALRYVRYSPDVIKLLIRAACLILFASAFWALLPAIARNLSHGSLGYGFMLGSFGVGAVVGAIALQRAQAAFSMEKVISGATIVFALVVFGIAAERILWLLCIFSLFGGAAWTVFMSAFNTLIQKLAPDWVRARVLAVYLLAFQGSMALGSLVWGIIADHTSVSRALMVSSAGVAICVMLPLIARLPRSADSLDVWNHWGKLAAFEEPEPEDGPVLVTVEYKVDPARETEFLEAMRDYERIRRRDGAFQWGIFYDTATTGIYLETFLVASWAEHERQHDRFTMADRESEERVLKFVREPIAKRHFLYASRRE